MTGKSEWRTAGIVVAAFLACFFLPVGTARFDGAVLEAFHLVKWYAREHVLLCLVPAFFIAGAIGVFVSQASVMRYLGAGANKIVAYGVASVSGTVLAVCSCTVLPLFAGIYRMGAGLGPACAFLYSGPAINALAIVLTARILGLELGIARAVGAVVFSVVLGVLMHLLFRKEEAAKAKLAAAMPAPDVSRPLWQNGIYFALMVGMLVFANWGAPNAFRFELRDGSGVSASVLESPEDASLPGAAYRVKILSGERVGEETSLPASAIVSREPLPGVWTGLWQRKWLITGVLALAFGGVLAAWFGASPWKVAGVAAAVAVAAAVKPSGGLWVLVPFGIGVVGLIAILATGKEELREWYDVSWTFALQILPLLLGGVLVAGLLLGRVGHEGLIPSGWVARLVGGNSFGSNFFAALVGAFMYFATLTEVPILQGLLGAGMGKGPALALLLAGPALSLPNMIVIRSILGTKKTVAFVSLVVILATFTGWLFGALF